MATTTEKQVAIVGDGIYNNWIKLNSSITRLMLQFEELVSEDGEINEDDIQLIIDNEENIAEKTDTVFALMESIDGQLTALERKIEHLKTQQKSLSMIRDNAKKTLLKIGLEKGTVKTTAKSQAHIYETPNNKFGVYYSKSTVIEDESLIPDNFKKEVVTISIDKAAIKKEIESGKEVPGANISENPYIKIL